MYKCTMDNQLSIVIDLSDGKFQKMPVLLNTELFLSSYGCPRKKFLLGFDLYL